MTLFLTYVLVPDGRIRTNILSQQGNAPLRFEIDHTHAERTEPIGPALKILALANNHSAKAKLTHKAATIPARGKRGHHNKLSVTSLPAPIAEGIGLGVHGRVAVLNAAIVPFA